MNHWMNIINSWAMQCNYHIFQTSSRNSCFYIGHMQNCLCRIDSQLCRPDKCIPFWSFLLSSRRNLPCTYRIHCFWYMFCSQSRCKMCKQKKWYSKRTRHRTTNIQRRWCSADSWAHKINKYLYPSRFHSSIRCNHGHQWCISNSEGDRSYKGRIRYCSRNTPKNNLSRLLIGRLLNCNSNTQESPSHKHRKMSYCHSTKHCQHTDTASQSQAASRSCGPHCKHCTHLIQGCCRPSNRLSKDMAGRF